MPQNPPSKPVSQRSLTQEIPEREHSLSNSLGQDISYDADKLAQPSGKADTARHSSVYEPAVDETDEPAGSHGVVENLEDDEDGEDQAARTE